jgi:D-tyrosyl-tRNA(Tyr) deacylase
VDDSGTTVEPRYLLILSETDPVAKALLERWPSGEATGVHVEGATVRALRPGVLTLRRPGHHIFDERFDRLLPTGAPWDRLPLIFPSIHRSKSQRLCLTVHPIGNPRNGTEFGGEPRTLVPPAPRLMTAVLRSLTERAAGLSVPVTFEATHHGPALDHPAMFVEIFLPEAGVPDPSMVEILAEVLPTVESDPHDRVAVGIGGGHYAPHFTDLALARAWAFGHILSRHVAAEVDSALSRTALTQSGADGFLFARAVDAELPAFADARRLREADAPRRG